MREIIFRGKDVNTKEWREGYFYTAANGAISIIGDGADGYQVYRQTVGQYTGRADKNGVKIFEGDIVRFQKYLCDKDFVGAIEFIDDLFYGCRIGNRCYGFIDIDIKKIEVVGNIYDNPEPLRTPPMVGTSVS